MSTSTYLAVDCRLCGEVSHLPCTDEQLNELNMPRSERRFIQDIFPDLSVGDRELIISGTCNTCWQKLFGSDEDEEE